MLCEKLSINFHNPSTPRCLSSDWNLSRVCLISAGRSTPMNILINSSTLPFYLFSSLYYMVYIPQRTVFQAAFLQEQRIRLSMIFFSSITAIPTEQALPMKLFAVSKSIHTALIKLPPIFPIF